MDSLCRSRKLLVSYTQTEIFVVSFLSSISFCRIQHSADLYMQFPFRLMCKLQCCIPFKLLCVDRPRYLTLFPFLSDTEVVTYTKKVFQGIRDRLLLLPILYLNECLIAIHSHASIDRLISNQLVLPRTYLARNLTMTRQK